MARWSWTTAAIAVNLLLTTLIFPVLAQEVTLIPSSGTDLFPACGASCSLLLKAQNGCVPPAAPNTNQAIYVSCFCQSALIPNLHSNPQGVCDESCTSKSERQQLMKWYNHYCKTGGKIQDTGATTTTTSSGSSQTTTGSSNANGDYSNSNSNSGSSSSSGSGSSSSSGSGSWISTHGRWVAMIIVIFVGFAIIGVIGAWLKKRHDAKYPNLYHGVGGASSRRRGLFARSQGPGPGPPPNASTQQPPSHPLAPPPARFGHATPNSFASSSRTEMTTADRSGVRSPSRLQKLPPSQSADLGIQELPR